MDTTTASPLKPQPVRARPGPRRSGPVVEYLDGVWPTVDWPYVFASTTYWSWLLLTKGLVALLYVTLVRHGLLSLFDAFAIRLWKLPGMAWLGDSELTRGIDLALITSLIVFGAVSYAWDRAIRFWAMGDESKLAAGDPNLIERRAFVVYVLSATLIFADMALMYMAVTEAGWSRSSFSFAGILVSGLYGAILVFVTLKTLELEANCNSHYFSKGYEL